MNFIREARYVTTIAAGTALFNWALDISVVVCLAVTSPGDGGTRRRRPLAAQSLSAGVWALSGLGISVGPPEVVLLAVRVQYLGIVLVVVFWAVFALEYT